MKKQLITPYLFVASFIFCVLIAIYTKIPNPNVKYQMVGKDSSQFVIGHLDFGFSSHPLLFYDEPLFLKSTTNAKSFTTSPLRGGIIPHHLVVSDNIANFFKIIQIINPSTIVLIGPNHYEKGNFDVLTSLENWETPNGIVASDTTMIHELVNRKLAHIDEDTVEHDHSVASFPPFIKYFLPEAKVVPLILKREFSIADAEKLSTYLSQLPSDTFFIASVDFSHYLPKEMARQKDITTLKILEKRNYEELYSMNSDYLDSPSSIIVLMKIMEKLNVNQMQVFAHTNSADYPLSDQKSTTSHFIVGFY